MLGSNQIYNKEEIAHSGWVDASQKLSHTDCSSTPHPPYQLIDPIPPDHAKILYLKVEGFYVKRLCPA